MAFSCTIFSVVLTIVIWAIPKDAAKVTMLHMFGGSHHLTTRVIGEELARRGHEVTICVPGEMRHPNSSSIKIINFDPGFTKEQEAHMSRAFISSIENAKIREELRILRKVMGMVATLCVNLVKNKQVLEQLKSSDIFIAEFQLFCPPLISRVLQKKWIGIFPITLASFVSYPLRISLNPSYVPFFHSSFQDEMNFKSRFLNFVLHKLFLWIFPNIIDKEFAIVSKSLGLDSSTNIYDMMSEAEVAIGNCDFAVDFPFPLMPNTFCVGTFLTMPAKKLPSGLEIFINGSAHGFILVAFGTVFNTFTVEQVRTMAGALGKLKQRVVWQLQDSYDIPLPENIEVMKWLPQNDLLGHPKLRLFVSHVGISSLHQAAYHGVPLVCVPRAAEQWANAERVRQKLKMGEIIEIATATEQTWVDAISTVLTQERYLVNAKKVSHRLRTKKQSAKTMAADIIDYVIDNDYDVSHLKATALRMPWYIYELWDIYLFMLTIIIFSAIVVMYVWKAIKYVIGRKQKTKIQ